ncbi:MAG: M15 family metallopeptidase [Acidimicrobiales bacterium]
MHQRAQARHVQWWIGAAVGFLALAATGCLPVQVPPTPTLATATCPSGGTITVSATTVADIGDLLAAADRDGLSLCGSGYRSVEAQVAVRMTNCGPTDYDIWVRPSRECSPPTAIPGTSMHQKGLAIDFWNCSTRTTACYQWLDANAESFGLTNLLSEPWHWSTTGH